MSLSHRLSNFVSFLDLTNTNKRQLETQNEKVMKEHQMTQAINLVRRRLDFSEEKMDTYDESSTNIKFPREEPNRGVVRKFSSTDFQADDDHVHAEYKRRKY